MTAREIIRKEYGSARNFMTPRVRSVGRLPFGAYELSEGSGFEPGSTLYGVSVVQLHAPTSRTRRVYELSKCVHDLADARAWIKALKEHNKHGADINAPLAMPWDASA